jgi:hypothetical protein
MSGENYTGTHLPHSTQFVVLSQNKSERITLTAYRTHRNINVGITKLSQLDNMYLRQYFVNTGAGKKPNFSISVMNIRTDT